MKLRDLVLACCLVSLPALSFADETPAAPAAQAPAASHGLVVVGVGDAADATWPLAQGVYADAALRPSTLDEPHARVLAGEAPDANASTDLKELAELRAAIRGDDAPSRQLLKSIAERTHVAQVLVLFLGTGDAAPSARVFLVDAATFDAATYAPDDGTGNVRAWSGALRSLSRTLTGAPSTPTSSTPATAPTAKSAPLGATPPAAPKTEPKPGSKPFYLSPWFWGALGAAAFGGLAVFFVTRDTSDGQIHLQMQVPK